MLIAQTALMANLPLHTFNDKHFKAVPNLRTIQPYSR
jgi:predicted nucleic acid-binding protein